MVRPPKNVPKMMRCAVYDAASPSGVKVVEDAVPSAVRGRSALVRVHACGANPVDAKYVIGDKLPESWMGWAAKRVSGHTPGYDFSGIIVELDEHEELEVGDSVFGFACDPANIFGRRLRGSFAEYVAAPLDSMARKPAALSHAEAAALPLVGTTVMQVYRQHGLRPGQRVLVIGASGGVGHVGVQIAKHLGAQVVAVCSERNAKFVTEDCGAHLAIAYDNNDVFDAIKREAEANGPFDLVLDCVSSADSRDKGYAGTLRAMKNVISCSSKHNYIVLGGATADWARALAKRVFSLNLFPSGFELFWIKMPGSSSVLRELAEFASVGALKPRVDSLLPFSETSARAAFDKLRSRRTAGKIVMELIEEEAGGGTNLGPPKAAAS